jgi:hypothetical protein
MLNICKGYATFPTNIPRHLRGGSRFRLTILLHLWGANHQFYVAITDYRLQNGPKRGARERSQPRLHGLQTQYQTHHNQMKIYQFLTIQT